MVQKLLPHSSNQCMFSNWSPGIDSEGHAANFVETEQIVLYEGAMSSFVQAGLVAFDLTLQDSLTLQFVKEKKILSV